MQRDEVVSVVVITPPKRQLLVKAQTPPIESRPSSTRGLSPSPRQYLHAIRPDQPAPRIITSKRGTLSFSCIVYVSQERSTRRHEGDVRPHQPDHRRCT